MKIDGSKKSGSFFAYEGIQREEADKRKGRTIFAGELLAGSKQKSLIEQRKEKAGKEAMQVVRTQFESDAKIDDDMEERRNRIEQLKTEADGYNTQLNEYRKMREELGKKMELSGEGTEYQEAAEECDKQIEYYDKLRAEALEDIHTESAIIQQTKQARLKSKGMIDAQKTAEDIEQAASREVIGMLISEAKEHRDEKIEELTEEAEKAAEKKKEEEERLTKKTEEPFDEVVYELPKLNRTQEQVQEELKEIVEKNKLLQEDLKGITVNESV